MKLPPFASVILAHIAACGSSLYRRTPPGLRPFLPYIGGILFWALVIAVLACFNGCHAAPPAHILLPTAAQVQARLGAPIAAATASNARAVQLAARAEKAGIAAGSADAHTLTLVTSETARQLADALAGKDALTAQINTGQKLTDALEKDDAEKTRQVVTEKARGDKEEALHDFWRRWCILGFLAVDVLISLAGAALQSAFRKVEGFVAKEAVASAETVAHLAMKIPAVAGTVLKIAAVVAAFL